MRSWRSNTLSEPATGSGNVDGVLILKSLCGSLRISASSVFKLPFNAENAEIRRGRRETLSI